jgi:hypothetical protein
VQVWVRFKRRDEEERGLRREATTVHALCTPIRGGAGVLPGAVSVYAVCG